MKRLFLISMAWVIAAPCAHAQGTINFANTAASLVRESDGTTGVPVGTYTVGLLYWAADPGNVNLFGSIAGLTMIKTTANFVAPGRFIGGTATTPATTAPGADAWFAVVAWGNVFGSYDAALTGAGTFGFSSIFQNATGNPTSVPPGPPAAMSGFTGSLPVLIPEPTAMTLGAIGALAVLLRRSKT